MKKTNYRPLSKSDKPLVCFVSEHGNGQNREYLALLSANRMQEISLVDNTAKVYEQDEKPLAEYTAWKSGQMKEQGYRVCPFEKYLLAQNTLDSRLKGKPEKVKVKLRNTRFHATQLTGGTKEV